MLNGLYTAYLENIFQNYIPTYNARRRLRVCQKTNRSLASFFVCCIFSYWRTSPSRSGRRVSYSSLLIPTMGWSCLFYKKWRVHGAWHPSSKYILESRATRIPMTHCSNPALQESGAIAIFSCSRPCRDLDSYLLTLKGCPDHCVTRVFWFLTEGPQIPLVFFVLFFGDLLGSCRVGLIFDFLWNLLGISLESLWKLKLTYSELFFIAEKHAGN